MRRPPRTVVERIAAQHRQSLLTDDFEELMSRPDKPSTPAEQAEFKRLMEMDDE